MSLVQCVIDASRFAMLRQTFAAQHRVVVKLRLGRILWRRKHRHGPVVARKRVDLGLCVVDTRLDRLNARLFFNNLPRHKTTTLDEIFSRIAINNETVAASCICGGDGKHTL